MEDLAIKQFKRDYTLKIIIQEKQFEQWLRFTFYINDQLSKNQDILYQDIFYVKLFETLSEGLEYAKKVHNSLTKTSNKRKTEWYSKLITGLSRINQNLNESEFTYIEYRRHCASHIFQNQYEHIQEDLRIKTKRKNKELVEIRKQIESLISQHGNEQNLDIYLNGKLQPLITELYSTLLINT